VSYDTNASIRNELECIQRLGPENCTSDVINTTVIAELNGTTAGGATNLAGGIKEGIAVLSAEGGHYGRPRAAHIMVLMTDGEANVVPKSYCYAQDLWPDNSGTTDENRAKDCVIYYANEARDNGIVIHTTSLGYAADLEIMQEVADITGGTHRWAPTPAVLDAIFDEISASLQSGRPSVTVEAIYHRASPTDGWTQHPLALTEGNTATRTITGTNITALSQWTLGPAGPFAPDAIVLEADPTALPADDTSTAVVTATISDLYGQAVQDGTVVTFTTSLGAIAPTTGTIFGGIATTTLTSSLSPGQAMVTATAGERTGITVIRIGRCYCLPLIWRDGFE
jgi:hypothetical protein